MTTALRKANPQEVRILNQLADELEPRLAAAFRDAILGLRDDIDISALLTAIASGDPQQVQDILQNLPTMLQPVQEIVAETLLQAATAFAIPLQAQLGGTIQFDMINPRVVEWMRENAAALVTNIGTETEAALRAVLAQAAEEGVATVEVANLIGDMVGLNERQANALYNYWAGLDEQGVDPEEAQALTDAYAERLLNDRSDMIARTEIVHAANEGQQQLWEEAADQGLIDRETAQQEWILTAGACELCQSIADNGPVGLGESFVDDEGEEYDQPPAHPRCRCAIGLIA